MPKYTYIYMGWENERLSEFGNEEQTKKTNLENNVIVGFCVLCPCPMPIGSNYTQHITRNANVSI